MHTRTHDHDITPLPIWLRALMTITPLVAFGIILTLAWILSGAGTFQFILSMVVGSFVGLGKFVVFAGAADQTPLGPWYLVCLVVFGDVSTALIMIGNVHYFYRIPKLGTHLKRVQQSGHTVLAAHKWMRRISWLGLTIFVAVPFQGTGAVLGVFLGRILGLTRFAIISAITTGSLVGSSVLAILAGILGKTQQERIQTISKDPVLVCAMIATCLIVTYFLGKWFLGDTRNNQPNDMPR